MAKQLPRSHRKSIRFADAELKQFEKAARDRGLDLSGFLRDAAYFRLHQEEVFERLQGIEDRIGGSFDKLLKSQRDTRQTIGLEQARLGALLLTFVKLFLMNTPAPKESDQREVMQMSAEKRYADFVRMAVSGTAVAAASKLIRTENQTEADTPVRETA